MEKKKTKTEVTEKISCADEQCWKYGKLAARGRSFEGEVIKKFPRRIVIQFERTIYIKKYERYMKKKARLHARVSKCMENEVEIGDYVQIRECRPLSKIIHFTLIKIVRKKE